MIGHPPFAIEIPAHERRALFLRRGENEVRNESIAASHKTPAEDPSQKASERERVIGQLVVLMRAGNDTRHDPERLMKLLGVDLQILAILVRNAQPVAREAAVRDHVAKQLIKGR